MQNDWRTLVFLGLAKWWLLTAACNVAAFAEEPPSRPSMTPQEWERYQARDTFAEAVGILDDPDWHEIDPWVRYFRAEDEDPARAAPERTRGYIESRERVAIDLVITQQLPRDTKERLLTKYLSHHNHDVAQLSLVALISSGMWSTDRATTYIRQNDPTAAGWYLLLTYLPAEVPQQVRREIARETLRHAQKRAPDYRPGSQPGIEIDAARVLLESTDENDRTLIRWAVRQYPDAPLLWAAVSRLPEDEQTSRLARAVYEDRSASQAARFAAAIAFAKNDPQIMRQAADEIMVSVREFGSEEYVRSYYKIDPTDVARTERVRKGMDVEDILVAANELPADVWRPHLDEVVRHPYLLLGGGVCAIVAKALPSEFVDAVSKLDSVPDELDPPLAVAIQRSPGVSERVKGVLPPSRYEKLERSVQEHHSSTAALRRLTLWD